MYKRQVIYGPLIHYQDHIVKIDKHNRIAAVSYTHLDVYKRQNYEFVISYNGIMKVEGGR